ncbi:MAG TPA: hypothetical protein VGF17_21165 [Phytomonospora sp.]
MDAWLPATLRALYALDLGEWGPEDIGRVLVELGWTPDGVTAGLLRTPLPGGLAYLGDDADHGPVLSVPIPSGTGTFRTARRLAEDVLGPPTLLGGPGAWLRWRAPATTIRLDARSIRLTATDRFEATELRTFAYEFGAGPYLWCMAPAGRFLPGDRPAADWDELTERLTATVESLAADLPALDQTPATLSLNGGTGPVPPTCYVAFGADGLRVEFPGDPTPERVEALTGMGWRPPSEEWVTALADDAFDWSSAPSGSASFSADVGRDAGEATRLAVGALRELGLRPDALTYWMGRDGEGLNAHLPYAGVVQG